MKDGTIPCPHGDEEPNCAYHEDGSFLWEPIEVPSEPVGVVEDAAGTRYAVYVVKAWSWPPREG